jgi:replicative DNA helicase
MNAYDEDPDERDNDPRPRDIGAEQAVLGAMLLAPRAVDDVAPTLGDGSCFYRPAHEVIYRAILAVHDTPGVAADPITVAAKLRADGDIAHVGGDVYLFTLVNAVPTTANAEYYADIVVATAQLRKLYEVGFRLMQRCRMQDADPDEIASTILTEVQRLFAESAGQAVEKLSVADRWPEFLDELEAGEDPRALDTPWKDLNEVITFRPKAVTVVGAPTSGGKTLFAGNMGTHAAFRRGLPVLVASMEMGGSEVLTRMVSAEANIKMDNMTHRRLGEDEWRKIARINDQMTSPRAAQFIIDDSPVLTISKIRSRARWMVAQGFPPGLIIVDYAQLVTPEGPNPGKNRTQDVSGISLGLKSLADEFNTSVLVLAQFNRGAAGRRPLVTDFKDSSQIEQDASTVVLLHRELDEEGQDTGPNAGKVMAIVAKNRNGKRGIEVWLQFAGEYASLRNLTMQAAPN